jgi:hypothetical protein
MEMMQPATPEAPPQATGDKVPVHSASFRSAVQSALRAGTVSTFGSPNVEGIWIPEHAISSGPPYPGIGPNFPGIGPNFPGIIDATRHFEK